MSSFLPIATERLTLRLVTMADCDALYSFLSLPEVAEFQFWDPMDRAKVAEKAADWSTLDGEDGRHLELGVVLKDTGVLIGDVFLGFRDMDARQAEIGYSLHPGFQRRGYGFEAVKALMDLGFGHFGMHRIFGRCDARNQSSFRLMERLGMRREAHFREHALFKGGWDEEFYYAILEYEWRARHAGAR
jgi:RimJ/RimL family protein N-acetyltransferase